MRSDPPDAPEVLRWFRRLAAGALAPLDPPAPSGGVQAVRFWGSFQLSPLPLPLPPAAPNLTQMKRKAVIFHFCSWWWLLVVVAADPIWDPIFLRISMQFH